MSGCSSLHYRSMLAFIAVVLVGLLPVNRYKIRLKIRHIWAKSAVLILNYKVELKVIFHMTGIISMSEITGHPWIHLFASHYLEANPVSRSDVRNYPFVGKGAEISGIIFVNKESKYEPQCI